MIESMEDAWASVDHGEVVLVSHQLPIWMVHRQVAGLSLPHSPQARRCTLCSITSFEKGASGWREVDYVEPAKELLAEAVDLGAV
jgi:broad specificity phosphatase PhoE